MPRKYRSDGLCPSCELRPKRPSEGYCKPCRDEYNRVQTLKRYGLTPEQFDEMERLQGGVCFLCERPPNGRYGQLVVDHCHASGRNRKLLCSECNLALGKFHDNALVLKRAAEYVSG